MDVRLCPLLLKISRGDILSLQLVRHFIVATTEQFAPNAKIRGLPTGKTVDTFLAPSLFRSAMEQGFKLLVLIDEIDALSQSGKSKLRSFIQSTGLPLIAASASSALRLRLGDSHFGSPWFNFFRFESVGLFTYEKAREMLVAISEKSGKQFTDQECAVLIEIVGTFPFFLQVAGGECFRSEKFISNHDRRGGAFKSALANLSLQVIPHFSAMLDRLSEEERDSLVEIARGASSYAPLSVEGLASMALITRENSNQPWRVFSSSFRILCCERLNSGNMTPLLHGNREVIPKNGGGTLRPTWQLKPLGLQSKKQSSLQPGFRLRMTFIMAGYGSGRRAAGRQQRHTGK